MLERVMEMFDWVVFDKGQARFCGGQRNTLDDSGSRETLAVQLNGRKPYYGQYRTPYELDKTHYNVEVLSFGYPRQDSVGLPAPTARALFTPDEIKNIAALIAALMRSDIEKPAPMQNRERFLGGISFREGWIRAPL
jgi:hypothetical protein